MCGNDIGIQLDVVPCTLPGVAGIAEQIRNHPLHDGLQVAAEGAEIFWSVETGAAAGFSSPLSLPYLLDRFVRDYHEQPRR